MDEVNPTSETNRNGRFTMHTPSQRHPLTFMGIVLLLSLFILTFPGCRKKRKNNDHKGDATVEQVSQACLDARKKIAKAEESGQPEKIVELIKKSLAGACESEEKKVGSGGGGRKPEKPSEAPRNP